MNTKTKSITSVMILFVLGLLVACAPQTPPEPEADIPTGGDALSEAESGDTDVEDEDIEDEVEVMEESEAYPPPSSSEAVVEPSVNESLAAYPYPEPEAEEFVETEGLESVDPKADPTEAPAATGEVLIFTVDPTASQVSYSVEEEFFNREVQFVTAIGTTSEIDGSLSVDLSGAEPIVAGGEINVDISTLQSDSNRRDNAIRNDWLESATYPVATFVPTSIANYSGDYTAGEVTFDLVGNLTVREITNEVTFNVTATLDGETLRGSASTLVMMVDYGFDPPDILNILTVTDGVTVTIDLVALQS